MTEEELLNRLCEIRDEANEHGRYKIKRMVEKLINDRRANNE